jgi:branched-chain amino acid transport system permease protein
VGQQIVNGLFLGSIYALFALGYTLVFGVLDILNLAHQAVFMVCAYAALVLVVHLHMPMVAAFPVAVLLGGLLGMLVDRIAFKPLRGRSDSNIAGLISSIALATILEAGVVQFFGPDVERFPFGTVPTRSLKIGDAVVSELQIIIIAIALVMLAGLTWLLRRTQLGRRIRAVAESPKAARVLGVNVDRIISASFFVSSALGAAAGVLFGLAFNNVAPDMGRSVELKGLAVIVLGGMGSMPGAALAGMALGLLEVFTVAWIGSSYRDAVAFGVLFLVLVLRPRGLLGSAALREA